MLELYAHPFSSYCWKVLIPLYENDTPFTYRSLEEEGNPAEFARLWPIGKFPLLVDDGRPVMESSIKGNLPIGHNRANSAGFPSSSSER